MVTDSAHCYVRISVAKGRYAEVTAYAILKGNCVRKSWYDFVHMVVGNNLNRILGIWGTDTRSPRVFTLITNRDNARICTLLLLICPADLSRFRYSKPMSFLFRFNR